MVGFEYSFFKIGVLYLQWTKRTGKTKKPDASPKYVLSMDRLDFSRDGISHINIVDFLLGKKELMLT